VCVRSIFSDGRDHPGHAPLWAWWALMILVMTVSFAVIALRYRKAET
jgi:hypothetical protein